MTKITMHIGLLGAVVTAAVGFAAPASAQATRTWVSGTGDDANPCSRTAPCKTFAGTISKTAAAGEINCLDPGGFGGVTITKSLSIVCDYTEGGALVAGAGVNGIVINLPLSTDTVFLSGIDLNGAGTGQNGIRIVSTGIVHVRNSIIRNFRASNGLGMSVAPSGLLLLTVSDTVIDDNGTGATGGGILVQPTGAGGSARVSLRNVLVQNNAGDQLKVDTTGNTGAGVTVNVLNSEFTGGTNGINVNVPSSNANLLIKDSVVQLAGTNGILANGAQARLRVANTMITSNTTGVTITGGATINTYGNNQNDGNGAPGAFTLPAIPEG